MNSLAERIRKYIIEHRKDKAFRRGVRILGCLVVFITTYALIYPALALEKDAYCGIEAHVHTDECYALVLNCGQEETDGHTHTDACYETRQTLDCELEEHIHGEDCYDGDGDLICDLAEHTHSQDAGCYETEKVLACNLKEADTHWHDASCYKMILVCDRQVHVHSEVCYRKPEKENIITNPADEMNNAGTEKTIIEENQSQCHIIQMEHFE